MSAFIYVTGGIMSDFSSLYLLPILAASTLRHRRGALQVAGVSAVFYLGIVLSQYTTLDTFPHWARDRRVGAAGAAVRAVRARHQPVRLPRRSGRSPGRWPSGCASPAARLVTASETIEDLRAFNEHVINSLVSGLVTADADCRILTFNRAASAITGVHMGAGHRPPRRHRCWACRRTSSTA